MQDLPRSFWDSVKQRWLEWHQSLPHPTAAAAEESAPGVTDHGNLGGLAANDHPQYLLAQDLPEGGGEGGVTDHGDLSGLSDDDHPQYATDGDLSTHAATPHGGGGGVTDHGALTGLADNDHLQYALDANLAAHAAAADPHAGYVQEAAVPGGELGGTYAVPTVDPTHAGSTHGAAVTTHEAAADPHAGYRLESDNHTHTSSGLQAGTLDAANITFVPSWAPDWPSDVDPGNVDAALDALAGAIPSAIQDDDADTHVRTETTPNINQIRMTIGATERLRLSASGLDVGANPFFGGAAIGSPDVNLQRVADAGSTPMWSTDDYFRLKNNTFPTSPPTAGYAILGAEGGKMTQLLNDGGIATRMVLGQMHGLLQQRGALGQIYPLPGGDAISTMGCMSGAVETTNNSTTIDGFGHRRNYGATAAGGFDGVSSPAFVRIHSNMNPWLLMKVRQPALTNRRDYVGYSDQTLATMLGADQPAAGHYFGFRYDSSVSANWRIIRRNGTTVVAFDTGIAARTSNAYYFAIKPLCVGAVQTIVAQIYDVTPTFPLVWEAAFTTTLPDSGTNLGWMTGIQSLAGASSWIEVYQGLLAMEGPA